MKKITLLALALASFGLNAAVTQSSTPALAPTIGCVTPGGNAEGTGSDATDTVTFTETGTISDINVEANLVDDWRQEMQIDITYNGNTVILASQPGPGTNTNDMHAIYDDEAATTCAVECAIAANCTSGAPATCSPIDALSVFDGGNAITGDWTIRYCDASDFNSQNLATWSVTAAGDDQLPVELMTLEIE